MDVILLNGSPGAKWVNFSRYIGPYKLSHWVKKHGYTCQVIDYITWFTEEELYAAVKKFITNDTLVVGVSTTFIVETGNYKKYRYANGKYGTFPEPLINVLRAIKREHPNIKIVNGGYGSDTAYMGGVADATVMSYTSETSDIFLEYLDHLRKGTPRPLGELRTSFIGLDEVEKPRMIYNQARNPKYNIETDDFKFVKEDVIIPGETLPLDVSRGCIFACRFCQYPHLGKHKLDYIRAMSLLKEELIHNYENFGTKNYIILDDTFNDTEWKLQEFHKITTSLPFEVNYAAYLRADLIDRFPDTAHLIKESGCFGAYHGIESLHPYASKLVGKAWSGKRAREFIPYLFHDLWKGQVPMHTNFLVGLPKETLEDLKSTVRWFIENKLHSIRFKGLNVNGEPYNRSNRTIMSEFDRNAEKYGFQFEMVKPRNAKQEDAPLVRQWYNETWKQADAFKTEFILNKYLQPYRRMQVWHFGNLQLLGYSKEWILNTRLNEFDPNEILEKEAEIIKGYKKQLMALPT